MNLVLIHKKFRAIARERKREEDNRFGNRQALAQKKFDYLNNDVQQGAYDERFKQANADLAEAFSKFANAIKNLRKVKFQEGGKRAGKTRNIKDILAHDFGLTDEMNADAQAICDAYGVPRDKLFVDEVKLLNEFEKMNRIRVYHGMKPLTFEEYKKIL